MRLLQQAEQVAREVMATRPDIVLKDIELVNLPTGPVIVVSIQSARPPGPERVARFEALLRGRLAEPGVRVLARVNESVDITSKGRVLFGDAHFGSFSAEQLRQQRTVEDTVRANLENLPNTFVTAIDAVPQGSGWSVRADVVAPRVLAPDDVHGVETRAAKLVAMPVDVLVRARTDVLVSGTAYQPVGELRPEPTATPAP